MKITVLGAGYVGLTTAACMAEKAHKVICADIDRQKINGLKKNNIPFFEPGLDKLVKKHLQLKNLQFSNSLKTAIQNSDVIICCVWTPPKKNFKADIMAVINAAKDFGQSINSYKILIIKSTVPPGTNKICALAIQEEIKKRNIKVKFDIVSNPEFLRQGSAVRDTLKPDRIVAGINNKKSVAIIKGLYKSFQSKKRPIIFTTPESAEIIKYAANSYLAMKLSFINEIAGFCEIAGVNIKEIEKGLKFDKRIGLDYLHAGVGYGGGCLKKDINAMIHFGKEKKYNFKLLKVVDEINEKQKLHLFDRYKGLADKNVAVLGLSFKPDTDSVKEAASIAVVNKLIKLKAKIKVYDPAGLSAFLKAAGKHKNIMPCKKPADALRNADVLMILTAWPQFKKITPEFLKKHMKGRVILDGRNLLNQKAFKKAGFEYIGIG